MSWSHCLSGLGKPPSSVFLVPSLSFHLRLPLPVVGCNLKPKSIWSRAFHIPLFLIYSVDEESTFLPLKETNRILNQLCVWLLVFIRVDPWPSINKRGERATCTQG